MFDYIHDEETGGILLIDKPTGMSNEPRPVYTQELDLLGINKYYCYDPQTDIPYMWAEAQRYYYRGKNIFNTKGGSLYTMPEVQILKETDEDGNERCVLEEGTELQPVNMELMIKKNHDLLEVLEQITIKKVYGIYRKYKKKVDRFHIALSGGKDSIVVFDVCRKALPDSSYVVIFGDTKMEFPDTYAVIDQIEQDCLENNIEFYRAASHFEPEESWRLFGPPSRVLRWCCTVHKSTPQTIKLREITGKNNYIGLDFVGVRKHESVARSKYDEENYGKKQKGQYSYNPILEWTSAEVWLYIYANDLVVNAAYKKGNSRAGCLFCPMATGKSYCMQYASYPNEVERFVNLVRTLVDDSNIDSYIDNGGFNSRRSGRDLIDNELRYFENQGDGKVYLTALTDYRSWSEWKKTVPNIDSILNEIVEDGKITIVVREDLNKLGDYKILKQALRKSAYCVSCRACETNCWSGALKFTEDGVKINNCVQCGACHEMISGCMVAESRKKPMKEEKTKSINCFDSHAPMGEWIKVFFEKPDGFLADNDLGPNQIKAFKRFLNDTSLMDTRKKALTEIGKCLINMPYDSELVTAVILTELAYNNAQFNWYIMNMQIGTTYSRNDMTNMLREFKATDNDIKFIISALNRIANKTPFGTTLNFMSAEIITKGKNETVISAKRNKCTIFSSLVLLYALYRYAEENGGMWSFSLSSLLDMSRKSAGISPARIFGLDGDDMEPMLRGLSAKYEDFINVTFTHDLDKITLRDYHNSMDVLKLFEEE